MAKPVAGLMHLESVLNPTGIDVTPVGSVYTLPVIVSTSDAITALVLLMSGALLSTSDVDIYVDGVQNGVMHFDTNHRDYQPGAPLVLPVGAHEVEATFVSTDLIPLSTVVTLKFQNANLLAPDFHSNAQVGECPLNITFTDDTVDNLPTTRRWDFGDGHFSNLQNPVHRYYQAGTFTVTLTVTSEDDKAEITKVGYLTFTETTPGRTNLENIAFARDGVNSFPPLDADSVVEDDDRIRIEGENSRP